MEKNRPDHAKRIWNGFWCALMCAGVLIPSLAIPADHYKESGGDIHFFLDYACFKSLQGDEKIYVEFYFTLARDQLTFSEKEGGGYAGAYEIEMTIDSEGRKPEVKSWLGGARIDSLAEASLKLSLFDVEYFLLDPGRYTFSARLTDLNSERRGTLSERMTCPDYKDGKLALSEIEFASRIEAATSDNKFVKNNILVLPNPLHLYGIQMPAVSFYAELYGLQFDESHPSAYSLQFVLIDSTDSPVKSVGPKTVQKAGATAIIAEQTNIVTLGAGRYTLKLTVTDDATGATASTEGTFRVLMPQRIASASVNTVFDEDRSIEERNLITYITSKQEMEMYDGLSLEGKKSFLDTFWATRDPDPATPENEFRMEHLKRFTFVNVNFTSTIQKSGWKSDMGRVYIQHGPPDEIERHPADAENNAWEKWIYEALKGQGNILFIFGDLEGFGRYTLLHSNLQYEKYDENWEKWINRYSGRY